MKRTNNKSIQEEYKTWALVTEAYGYVVQFWRYKGAKKVKQVALSTKWGLGENVVLRLMERLILSFSFDIFIENYFTSFRLFTHLESTTLEQQVCSAIKAYANPLSLVTSSCKKKERGHFEQHTSSKNQCNFDSCCLEWQQCSLLSFFWTFSAKEICLVLEQSWKKLYSRATTKSIPLLQPEHGFCQQDESEHGYVQDWYPNKKMLVVRVCLNGKCSFSGCVGLVSY